MNVAASPKLVAYAVLSSIGLAAALALGTPAPAILGSPFLIALVLGLAMTRVPDLRVDLELERDHIIEGEETRITIVARSTQPIARLEVAIPLEEGLEFSSGPVTCAFALQPGIEERVERLIRSDRWGGYTVGDLYVRARDRFGFVVGEARFDRKHPLRVYPAPASIDAMVVPVETQRTAGNERSNAKGDGIEFVDVRPYAPGDRLRSVNWRLSTRARELHVNEFHREENADVVIFLDSFMDVRRSGQGTLDAAVRAASILADRYLERRDRVGVIGFGGVLRWLRPGMGDAQRYRIIESLIDTEVVTSFAWRRVSVIPPEILPSKALIIAITPLVDERAIDALFDLRARRFDLTVIEISPLPFVGSGSSVAAGLARRLWALDRERLRFRFRQLGVPVVVWDGKDSLDMTIREVQAFRRYMLHTRAQ